MSEINADFLRGVAVMAGIVMTILIILKGQVD